MSVMLRSTNPEAAGELELDRDRRVPYVGQAVVYHLRPGEGRGGKSFAPALVTRVEDDDHVELLIMFAADDFLTRWKIPRKTDQNPVNAWTFNDWDEKHYQPDAKVEPPAVTKLDLEKMHGEIEKLGAQVKSLEGELRRHHQNQNAQRVK